MPHLGFTFGLGSLSRCRPLYQFLLVGFLHFLWCLLSLGYEPSFFAFTSDPLLRFVLRLLHCFRGRLSASREQGLGSWHNFFVSSMITTRSTQPLTKPSCCSRYPFFSRH